MNDKQWQRRWACRFAWWYGRVAAVSFCFGVLAGIGVVETAARMNYHYPAAVVAFCLGAGLIYIVYLADRWESGKKPSRQEAANADE